MADPYGYADAEVARPASSASLAMYAGIFALVMAAVGPCLCYMPYLFALPLGGYAVFAGSQVQSANGAERAMGVGGMVAGGVAALLSGLFLFAIAAYMVLVFGVMALGN